MANLEHLEILEDGVEVWNRWREESPDVRPDLSRTDLQELDFSGATLSGADLYLTDLSKANLKMSVLNQVNLNSANLARVDLSGASLLRANLSKANLFEANLNGADLIGADLSEASLIGANLVMADLREVKLIQADLTGADLTGAGTGRTDFKQAKTQYTVFTDVDLSSATGLDTIEHGGPSYIDIRTLYRSKGNIPEAFLRGVGVPDTFITYVISLTDEAIQYYSCFISYSAKDQDFAERLHADLQQKGVRCWFAREDMKIGDKIRSTIDRSIRVHDKLLLILSENSLNSFWVESEVEKAFEEERQRSQTVLFPVRLDEAVMETDQSWATEIRRTRHIGDFSQWKDHDEYQSAFERLLRDLKAEG